MNKIKYTSGYKYQLSDDYTHILLFRSTTNISNDFVSLSNLGVLTIKKGYAWDGPSGPTLDTKNFMRGSLVHDALYQLMREERLSKTYKYAADLELERICKEDGMSSIRAWYVYKAVSKVGDQFCDPEACKQVMEAP